MIIGTFITDERVRVLKMEVKIELESEMS